MAVYVFIHTTTKEVLWYAEFYTQLRTERMLEQEPLQPTSISLEHRVLFTLVDQ